MSSQNSRSDTVLDGGVTLSAGIPRNEGWSAQGETPGRGSAPPPPHAGNVADPRLAAKLASKEAKEAAQRRREIKRQMWQQRARGLDRSYYLAAAGIVGAGMLFLGARSLLGMQRDTALALSARQSAPVDEQPQQVVVQGIENPLEQLALTYPARWMIGLDSNGALVPNRSTDTMAALLQQVDLCGVFIRLGDNAEVELLDAPVAGAQPFVDCPAATPTTVETFVDPAPATTVAGG